MKPDRVCLNCQSLYVKDFATGECEDPDSGKGVVNPYDTCPCWKEKHKQA